MVLVAAIAEVWSAGEGEPGKRWRDGPVRYLLSDAQYREYGRLASLEQRQAFVQRFWWGLDPDPTTAHNEFRERFEERCRSAGRRYGDGAVPGWRTDQGRVFVLLGEPDAVRRDAGGAMGRLREIWTYARSPGAAAQIEISFYRDRGGNWHLRPERAGEPEHSEVARQRQRQNLRQQLRNRDIQLSTHALEQLLDTMLERRSGLSDLGSAYPGRPATGVRPASPSGPTRSGAGSGPDVLEETYYFRASDGSVLAMLALGLRASDPARGDEGRPDSSHAVAWILETGPWGAFEGESGFLREVFLSRQASPDGGTTELFTARVHLEPGPHGIRYAVTDAQHRVVAVLSDLLDVPDLDAELSASSVVPAERFGKAPGGSESPFAVGSEEVVPRPGGRFHHGEPLRLYLQVYGAKEDPEAGAANVDVRFSFRRLVRGRYRRFRKPLPVRGAQGASMGLALPIGDWPVGEYRVEVDLHDRVSGARAVTQGGFSIVD